MHVCDICRKLTSRVERTRHYGNFVWACAGCVAEKSRDAEERGAALAGAGATEATS